MSLSHKKDTCCHHSYPGHFSSVKCSKMKTTLPVHPHPYPHPHPYLNHSPGFSYGNPYLTHSNKPHSSIKKCNCS